MHIFGIYNKFEIEVAQSDEEPTAVVCSQIGALSSGRFPQHPSSPNMRIPLR